MRRKPYAAAFETTPERTAATSGDDSRYASGSQPCSGNSGALIANAATKPRKIHWLRLLPSFVRSDVLLDKPEKASRAGIMSRPPHVYCPNVSVAATRPRLPQ